MRRTFTFQAFVDLCKDADALLSDLKQGFSRLHGHRPRNLKPAAVHYLARQRGNHVTLNNLFQIYGATPVSTGTLEKLIKAEAAKRGDVHGSR